MASDKPSIPRRVLKRAGDVGVLLALGIAALVLVPTVMGYHRYVILTGSMTGTYDKGSIIYDKPVPVTDLKEGDPITYAPPPGVSPQPLVTHRVHKIKRDKSGKQVFVTKGDANEKPDPWKFSLNEPQQDKVLFSVPYAGYIFMALQVRMIRMIIIGLPALILVLVMMRKLWKEAGSELARQQGELEKGEDAMDFDEPVLEPIDAPAAAAEPVFVPLPWTPVQV